MAMDFSPVTVADDGTETLPNGSYATALYNERKAVALAAYTPFGAPPPQADLAKVLQPLAADCNAIAKAHCQYMAANMAVTVTIHTTDAGLQRADVAGAPNTATLGPAANKTLTGTVS
jgi:hypothetical protein